MLELSFNLIVGLVVCAVVAVVAVAAVTAAMIQDQSAPQKEILSNVDERIDVGENVITAQDLNRASGFVIRTSGGKYRLIEDVAWTARSLAAITIMPGVHNISISLNRHAITQISNLSAPHHCVRVRSGCSNIYIYDGDMINMSTHGVIVDEDCDYIELDDLHILNSGSAAIRCAGTEAKPVEHVYIDECRASGVWCSWTYDVEAQKSVFNDTKTSGFVLEACKRVCNTDCSSNSNKLNGWLTENCDSVSWLDCTADDNQVCGFKNSHLSSFTMTDCTVDGKGVIAADLNQNGVMDLMCAVEFTSCSNGIIDDFHVSNVSGHGMMLSGCSNIVTRGFAPQQIHGNAFTALDCRTCAFEKCFVADIQGNGFDFQASCKNMSVSGCKADRCNGFGFLDLSPPDFGNRYMDNTAQACGESNFHIPRFNTVVIWATNSSVGAPRVDKLDNISIVTADATTTTLP